MPAVVRWRNAGLHIFTTRGFQRGITFELLYQEEDTQL